MNEEGATVKEEAKKVPGALTAFLGSHWVVILVLAVVVGMLLHYAAYCSRSFSTGQFAIGYFAAGQVAIGVFAVGTVAIGLFSVGVFSLGIFSLGIFSVGAVCIGLFARGLHTTGWGAARARTVEVETTAGKDERPDGVLPMRLLILEVVYLGLLVFACYAAFRGWDLVPGMAQLAENLNVKAAWAGALGGVTIGLYGVYNHVANKDFDPSYEFWYICKPIAGAIFGWFIVLVFSLGLMTLQSKNATNAFENSQLPLVLAFLAGFSERWVIRVIDRLMEVLIAPGGSEKNKKDASGKTQPKG
jgi:hypothetical protein